MSDTLKEVVAVFGDVSALDTAVYTLETRGFDRAAFSLLASEEAVLKKLGHRYQQVKDVEDDSEAPRETFFSRVSRLEMDYLPAPALASFGAVMFAGVGIGLPALIAAGSGALIGAVLGGIMHEHHAIRVREQLERGGLLLWVNVRNVHEEETALEILRAQGAQDVHVHTLVSKQ
jgi:hypothetical protein